MACEWHVDPEDTIRRLKAERDRLRARVAELENPWVSVDERLPKAGQWVVGKRGHHRPFTCRLGYSRQPPFAQVWVDAENLLRDPDIWMLIPPKGESGERD